MSCDGTSVISCVGLGKAYRMYARPEDRLVELVTRGRVCRHREHWAVRGVDLEVHRGEAVGVMGRNGAGKSTLLQMICGVLTPTEGGVEVRGRIAPLLSLGAGFDGEFTGRENVRTNAAMLGLSRREIESRMESIEAFAEIGAFMDQPMKTYSTGMQARLGFAVAAHVQADILVVDEALSVGDAGFAQKCMRFLRKFLEHGSLLFVSHSQQAVLDLCDRAVWLDEGRVRAEGTAKEVCKSYHAFTHQLDVPGRTMRVVPASDRVGDAEDEPGDRVVAGGGVDHRAGLLRASEHRNIGEVLAFDDSNGWWGAGGLLVEDAWLTDSNDERTGVIEGGERVWLHITARATEAIDRPVLGFVIKNERGQVLFGDNSFLSSLIVPSPSIGAGERCVGRFGFRMPYLRTGEYVVEVATASGEQHAFVQHQWVHSAVVIRVRSSHVVHGLVGVAIDSCCVRREA